MQGATKQKAALYALPYIYKSMAYASAGAIFFLN
jgi:hypothetical protein